MEIPETLIDKYIIGQDITDGLYDEYLSTLPLKIRKGSPSIAFIGVYNFNTE